MVCTNPIAIEDELERDHQRNQSAKIISHSITQHQRPIKDIPTRKLATSLFGSSEHPLNSQELKNPSSIQQTSFALRMASIICMYAKFHKGTLTSLPNNSIFFVYISQVLARFRNFNIVGMLLLL